MSTELIEPSTTISFVPEAETSEAKTAAARPAKKHSDVPVLGRTLKPIKPTG